MHKVCTVIVTYNGAPWIATCLQHLLASTYPTTVIVVDNFSTDGTLAILERFADKITLLKMGQNLGFGGGNNVGIKHAIGLHADFIFLLNQDAYINSPNCIGLLVQGLRDNPTFGILSPLQWQPDGASLDTAFSKYLKGIPSDDIFAGHGKPIALRFVNAACWMLPMATINKVGLFHPAFFHYGEDNNYSSRLQYHQLKIGVLAAAKVIHDRNNETAAEKKRLLRKMKTIPLYTLLDIRKPLPVAWLLGLQKLKRLYKKAGGKAVKDAGDIYHIQKKWFFSDLAKARQIRTETKKGYMP